VIDLSTGLGYPKKADDARDNPKVALLFSDPTGSGLGNPPMVLVQGIADVNDRDLERNRERYMRESFAKRPGLKKMVPPRFLQRMFTWYYTRIYVHVRPERVYVWPDCDVTKEPQLFDSHIEEVRSHHAEEPPADHAAPDRGGPAWDGRMEELGERYDRAVLSLIAPDGFPFSVRLPVKLDAERQVVRLDAEPVGVPLQPGLACVTAHEHDDEFTWQRNFQVRGDLVRDESGWHVVPHKLVGGMEAPPSALKRLRDNAGKANRFRRRAKTELDRRTA
jgi:hypothetical protein